MEETLTPSDAIRAIAEVGTYRQRLTARTIGTIWIIWGMAMGLFAMQDLFVPGSQLAAKLRDHRFYDLYRIMPAWILVDLGLVGSTLAATYAVWKMSAIAKQEPPPDWKRLALGLGLYLALLTAIVVGFLAVDFLMNVGRPARGGYVSIFGNANGAFSHLAWPILVAVTLAFRTRTRVSVRPAVAGILGMVLVAHLLGLWPGYEYQHADGTQLLAQGLAISAGLATFTVLLVFTCVGLWYFHRG